MSRCDRLLMVLFAVCMGFSKVGLIWEYKLHPSWRDRVFKAVGTAAYVLGWIAVISWFLIRYLVGPAIAYLMVVYFT